MEIYLKNYFLQINIKNKNQTIWEVFGLVWDDKSEEIEKLNSKIDELAKWFYYENDSIPDDWEEEKQGRLI